MLRAIMGAFMPGIDLSLERSRLELLYNVSRNIVSELDLAELLRRILTVTASALQASSGSIVRVDDEYRVVDAVILANGETVEDVEPRMEPLARDGLAGWVIRNRQGAVVPNTAMDSRWLETEASAGMGPRSVVAAPLLAGGRLLGMMTISHDTPDHYRQADLELLVAIADQAAKAVENANLYAAEQRRRRLADILQEVARTVNTTLELDHVLALILEQLARVVRHDRSTIFLRDEDILRVQAAHGYVDPAAVLGTTVPAPAGVLGQVINEQRAILTSHADARTNHSLAGAPDGQPFASWLGAPLIASENVIGVLAVESREAGVYTADDKQAVGSFAAQAATAVVNANLFEASRQHARAMAAVAETARALSATLDPDQVLDTLAQQVFNVLAIEAVSIALVEASSNELVFRHARGAMAEAVTGQRLPIGEGLAGWVVKNGRGVLVSDAQSDTRFYPEIDRLTGFETHSVLCAPIQLGSRTLGVIEAINATGASFELADLQLLSSMADLAGTALAHAQEFTTTQAAQQHYAGLFEDSIDPILLSDLDGHITDANHKAAETFGYARWELPQRTINDLHRTDDGDMLARLEQLVAGEEVAFEARARTADGLEIPVEIHAKRILAGDTELIQWFERDLSERAALEEMRDDLIAMIFHDLRSPLGNIISSLDVMGVSIPREDESVHSVLRIAVRSAGRLSRLVDSLLDLRRLEAGHSVVQKTEASITSIIAEAAEQVHPIAEAKNILLRFNLPSQLPTVQMDADMIRRVIINLMENAVKYTPGAGKIRVSASIAAQDIVVRIADTGPGIPLEEQSRVFEKFARVQREGAPKGLGLGLAFCKLAVEAHGGRIWASGQPAQGSVFSFTLPIQPNA